MKTYLFTTICWLLSVGLSAQVNSIASGDWFDPNIWDTNTIPAIGDDVFINNTHEVFISDTIAVVSLTIKFGGTLRADTDGYISGGTVTVNNGGTYSHNRNNGTIPTATWEDGSICQVIGWTSGIPNSTFRASLTQSFYDFYWNCPGQTRNIVSFEGNLGTVRGNLVVANTGANATNKRRLVLGVSDGSTKSLSVEGNFVVQGSSAILINQSGNFTLTVGGDAILASTYVYTGDSETWIYGVNSSTGNSNLVIAGDFNLLNGVLNLVIPPLSASQTGTITIGGDFNFLGGTLGTWASGGVGTVAFSGSTLHQYSLVLGTFDADPVNYSVPLGDTLDLGTYALGNTVTPNGTYTANGATIVRSLNLTGALSGNLFASTKTFNSGSSIIYGGAAMQYMGLDHPSTAGVTAVIDNASGVSLVDPVTIGGNLNLANGNVIVGANTLTLNANLINNGHSIEIAANSSLVINGTGAFGNIPLTGSSSISNFTLNRTLSGTATLASSLSITNDYIQNAGTLLLNDNTLTINNNFTGTAKAIQGTAISALIINGTGLMTNPVALSGAFGTVTLNQTQNLSATSNASITNLNLFNGTFSNASTISIAASGLITRTGGELTNEPGCTGTYHVLYQNVGSVNSGPELSPSLNKLANLTMNGTGTLTLANNIQVNGNLLLSDGTFDAASNTITLVGNLTSDALASLSVSTISFAGTSTISGSNIPELGNVNVLAGSTLHLPATIFIAGDVTLNASSVFNATASTITLSGTLDQDVNGGGKTFHIVDVDKPTGDVFLTGNVILDSLLTVSSANTIFHADGFLTLLSTSDKNFGNASIGALLNGAEVRGNVNTQRYVSKEGRIYRYISSPVVNASVAQLQDDMFVTGPFTGASTCSGCVTANASLFYYDAGAAAYQRFPLASNTETFEPGRGYVPYFRHDKYPGAITIDLIGEINQGTMNLPMVYNSTNPLGSWNLIGNPYPSSIYWDDQPTGNWTKVNIIDNTIAIRDNGDMGPRFLYWNGLIGDFDGTVAAGQAFWVEAGAASPQLTITENAKASVTGEFYRKAEPDVLIATVSKAGYSGNDRTYVQLHENARVELDFFDGSKLENDHFDLYTQVGDIKPLAINALNEIACGMVMNLGFRFKTNSSGGYVLNPIGSYTLSFNFRGHQFEQHEITLIDAYTNASTVIAEGVTYPFVVTSDPASLNANRFTLQFDGKRPKLDLPVAASHSEVCSETETTLSVMQSEPAVTYSVLLNGKAYSTGLSGNGNEIQFKLQSADLAPGHNEIQIGVAAGCGTYILANVQHVQNNKPAAPTTNSNAVCKGETVQLSAEVANGTVQWYNNLNASSPLATGPDFTSPAITETVVYFASVLNSNGCESDRIPVEAKVKAYSDAKISILESNILLSNYSTIQNTWYFNNELMSDVSGNRVDVDKTGTYKVVVQVEGCETSDEVSMIVSGSEASEKLLVIAYPNPAGRELHVRSNNGEIKDLTIVNAIGQVQSWKAVQYTSSREDMIINIEDLTDGVYLLKAETSAGTHEVRFVKSLH